MLLFSDIEGVLLRCTKRVPGEKIESKINPNIFFSPSSSFCPCRYGPVWGQFSGIQPHLYVADPELLKDVMVKSFDSFADRQHFSSNPKVELINTNLKIYT